MKKRKRQQASMGKRKTTPVWLQYAGRVAVFVWLPPVRWTMSLLLVAVVGYLAINWVEQQNVLPVEQVNIEGEFRYLSREDLRERALPHVTGSLLAVDLEGIRKALIDLPWVEDVSIRRQWPNTLSVRVIERQPVAYWGKTGLISAHGELFEPEHIPTDFKLVQMDGPHGQHATMLKQLGKIQVWLSDTGLSVARFIQDERHAWRLEMSNGLVLKLGRIDRQERLHRFVDIYSHNRIKHSETLKTVDMRYTNGLAVAWQENGA